MSIKIFTTLFILYLYTPLGYGTSLQISNVSMHSANDVICPNGNEIAKELLKEYIQRESSREKPADIQRLDYTISFNEEFIALEGEAYQNECKKIIEKMPGIELLDYYSFYKVGSHFFISRIYATGQKEQKNVIATILYSDYKLVGIIGTLDL